MPAASSGVRGDFVSRRQRRQRQPAQVGAVETSGEIVDLRRAGDGASLWLAIEAAQYARILLHEEPDTESEKRAMSEFVEAFARYTEVWEETASPTKAAFLATLGRHLATLEDCGLHVHWASVDRSLAASGGSGVSITLAVVSVGRTGDETIRVMIPRDLELGGEAGSEDDE